MKAHTIAALATACVFGLGTPAAASDDDILRRTAEGDVASVMDALVAAVEGAGATVFARVDHAAGAESVDMALDPAQLLIFGNPRIGTPAMQADPLAGLFLPLRVLVYRDGAGQVWLAYENPEDMLGDLDGVDDEDAVVEQIGGALDRLTGMAAGG